jgi:nucleoside-diphosphate-sugar epimerase
MRIFAAGASGVIGVKLVPLLVAAGHEVAGMTRSAEKAEALRIIGAEPVAYYEINKPSPPRIHVEEAARRTVSALARQSGVVIIVDT